MDRQVRINVKEMLNVFFNSRDVVHHEYAPQGQTVNKEYYRDVLRRLRDAVRRKREDLWSSGNWRLHHDNAPAHSSNLIKIFWQKNRILCFNRLLSLLIWPPATSGCSTNSRGHWKDPISDKRGHYGSTDSRNKLHSKRGFFGMLPTIAEPLGEECGVPRELHWGGDKVSNAPSKPVSFSRPKVGYL